MMDLQERGLCGVIFTVGGLKIVLQLVSTQMAFQASSNHLLKDLRQKWKVRHGLVVLQQLFIQIFEICWNIRLK